MATLKVCVLHVEAVVVNIVVLVIKVVVLNGLLLRLLFYRFVGVFVLGFVHVGLYVLSMASCLLVLFPSPPPPHPRPPHPPQQQPPTNKVSFRRPNIASLPSPRFTFKISSLFLSNTLVPKPKLLFEKKPTKHPLCCFSSVFQVTFVKIDWLTFGFD